MPKRKREEEDDDDVNELEDISVLFIPFDAAIQHYKRNSKLGVLGVHGTFTVKGRHMDLEDVDDPLVSPSYTFIDKAKISKKLNKIVRQECELIRNLHNPDSEYQTNFEDLIKSQHPRLDVMLWSERVRNRVERNLRGYRHYPTLIFLSENPTGADFPDELNTGVENMNYVKKHALNKVTVNKIARVNEMAVYIREDIDQRITDSEDESDEMFLRTETLTREVKGSGLYKATKDEFMLKVTIGKTAGASFTVAGVHLRAGLTTSTGKIWQTEREALQEFCEEEDIQLLVGDFNMDLQGSSSGGRGIYFDNTSESQPVYMIQSGTGTAFPRYIQQYSSSNGEKHYMGFFQADTENLRLVGPGLYGMMGLSGSRSLGSKNKYYSDHPSIYVQVNSDRVTREARKTIERRRILKTKRRRL